MDDFFDIPDTPDAPKFYDASGLPVTDNILNELCQPIPWTVEALTGLGFDGAAVRTWTADGRRAVPELARKAMYTTETTVEPTRRYVWGPDIPFFLGIAPRRFP